MLFSHHGVMQGMENAGVSGIGHHSGGCRPGPKHHICQHNSKLQTNQLVYSSLVIKKRILEGIG
jgi:hypothetical protein